MKEVYGNLWDYHVDGEWICITTNGVVRQDGRAVMGRGVAAQAKARFPALPSLLGKRLIRNGNHVQPFSSLKLFTFPVKHHWKGQADLNLIIRSSKELMAQLDSHRWTSRVVLPRPGCGNGQLDWEDVRDVIYPLLDDRVLVITQSFNRRP